MSVNNIISGLTIMVTGNFSPTIIQPNWLIKHKVEKPVENNLIESRFLTQNISDFSISGLHYMINLESLVIRTEIEPLIGVVDRLEKISKLLVHTPTTAINMIRYDHLRVKDNIHRTEIFNKLAPIQLGKNIGNGVNESKTESKTNLQTLTFREDFQNDGVSLTRFVTVEPSLNKAIYNDGIYIGVQFLFNKIEGELSFCDSVLLVKNEFDTRIAEAENIFSTIKEIE